MARVFIRDSAGLAASQYVARAILLARGVAAAAALGPAGFGAWNALNLILDYGAYASLGAIQGLDLVLPAAAARGETESARRAMRGGWWITLAGALAFAAGVVFVLANGQWVASSGWGWGAPALMLLAAILQLAILYHAATLRAHGDFSNTSAGLALQALVGGGIGIFAVWRFGVWGLLLGWNAGSLAAIAWMRRSRSRPPLLPAGPREGMALAARGFPIFAFFTLTLVIRSLDRIALARWGDPRALGLYSLGLTAVALVLYLPEAAAAVLFPRIAAAAEGARDADETRRQVVQVHRVLMVALPTLVGPGVLFAPWVLSWALPTFAASIEPLRVLAVAALVVSMATLPSYYLLGSSRSPATLWVPALAALVAAVAIFTTAMRAPGATPVAWAATLGYACFALAMLALATPRLATEPRDRVALLIGSLIPVIWASALTLWLSRTPDATLMGAILKSLAFLGLHAPVALVFGGVVRMRGK